VEEPVLEEPAVLELEQDLAPPAPQLGIRCFCTCYARGDPLHELHGQHVTSACLGDDLGDDHLRDVGVQLGHASHVLGLVTVVELLGEAISHLLPHRLEVDIGKQAEQGLEQAPEVSQVCSHDLVDQRVLDLDRHPTTVGQGCPMHLTDRGRGKSLRVEAGEEVIKIRKRSLNLTSHDLGGNTWRLPLQGTQDLGHLGRKQPFMKAQHLAHLHGSALEAPQRLGHPLGVTHEVVRPSLLDLGVRSSNRREPVREDRGGNSSHQPPELE